MSKQIPGVDAGIEIGDSASQWYHRLNDKEKGYFDRLVNNLQNPISRIPEEYLSYNNRYNEALKRANVASMLTQEQLYEIDTTFAQTYYDNNVTSQILAPITKVMSIPKWQSKMYTVSGDKYPNFVEKDFNNIAWFRLGVDKTFEGGLGQVIGYHLPWTLIDESREGLYDIQAWHALKSGVTMGKNWEERYWFGSGGLNSTGDIGVTGLLNEADLSTAYAIGAGEDNNVTAALDIDFSFDLFLSGLKTVYESGDVIVCSTPGIAQELLLHDQATTGLTELEVLWKKYFATGLVQEWWIINEMAEETLATDKQTFIMFKRSPLTMSREIIYPLQTIPVDMKLWRKDVKEVMLQADLIKWRNTSAALPSMHTTVNLDCTSTKVGLFQNGLFLSGKAGYHPFKLPSIYSAYSTS
jgi:hypothetical protein